MTAPRATNTCRCGARAAADSPAVSRATKSAAPLVAMDTDASMPWTPDTSGTGHGPTPRPAGRTTARARPRRGAAHLHEPGRHGRAGDVVALGVQHAAAGTHPLHDARVQHARMAPGVLVRETAVEHPRDDLGVLVRVRVVAGTRREQVLVVRDQHREPDVAGVVVGPEGERVPRGEPVGRRGATAPRPVVRRSRDHPRPGVRPAFAPTRRVFPCVRADSTGQGMSTPGLSTPVRVEPLLDRAQHLHADRADLARPARACGPGRRRGGG